MSSPRWPTLGSAGSRWRTSTRWGPRPPSSDRLPSSPTSASPPTGRTELGLRFDLTLGSGWSFGGPHISAELAARQLHWERREIGPGPLDVAGAVTLARRRAGRGVRRCRLTSGAAGRVSSGCPSADGRLIIEAGPGPRVVLLGYARLTGQNVKRAAAGAEGPVLDHYSAAATEAHLRAVGDPMLDAVPAELVGSVFCDSLEVYGADWTARLPAEFARRRGYDLLPLLYLLTVDGPDAATAPRRLPPHPGRAVRGELRRRVPALGRRARSAVSDPVVRDAARPRSAATGSLTCSRARAGAGARSPRPGGRPRPRTCTGARWYPPRPGPGCTRRPSAPPRST